MAKPKIYLQLFHGRKRYPDGKFEELSDWGTQGPIFGPLSYVHTTYCADVKLGDIKGDNIGDLTVVEDLLYYDNIYYGDWSVFDECELEAELTSRIVIFDEAKAKPPSFSKEVEKVICWKLTYEEGKQVQEILNRYVNEELVVEKQAHAELDDLENMQAVGKDIDYIQGLAKLFDLPLTSLESTT